MEKHDIKQVLHDHASDNIASVDLWPKIKNKLYVQRDAGSRQEIKRRRLSIRQVAVALAVLFAISVTMMSTVTARTAVEQVIERFGLVLVGNEPEPIIPVDSGVSQVPQSSEAVVVPEIPLGLAEAQQQVPFHIPQPSQLPDEVELTLVRVGKTASTYEFPPLMKISLVYRPTVEIPNKEDANITLEIIDGTEDRGGYAYPAAEAQSTMVDNQPAIYISGSWSGLGDERTWDDQADADILAWQANGFTYVLRAYKMGLRQEDLVHIAESLK